MKSRWLHYAVLRIASLLSPGDQRAEWVKEWQSELWYVPRRGATRFCLGAFRDALWLRRNNLSPVKRTGIRLESPLSCLAFLAALAALSVFVTVLLPAPHLMHSSHLRARDLPAGCIPMLLLSCAFLPAIRVVMGRTAANLYPVPWPSKLRLGIFLALKIALMQPIMLCGFALLIGPLAPLPFMLAFRWILTDQQQRCPVCLRLLTNPVRIGTASRTFLEWYGAESICSRGHGLVHIPEMSDSSSGKPQWLGLDDSWSGLFPEPVGGRR